MNRLLLTIALGVWGSVSLAAWAAEPAPPPGSVDFARDIYPLLARACFDCHGPNKQEGELRLDARHHASKGGASGPVIVPGQPDKSELLRRIALPKTDDEVMPARGEPLEPRQVALIRAWIVSGATWPERLELAKHWAYLKPVRPSVPSVRQAAWERNPLDRFILARLEAEGLVPSPEAPRATLIRRLSLDLVGLPPSPAEVERFEVDTSPDAYERLVDRLLASPEFGPRWARPWLDLARYADSHGFQRDDLRELWPYRDWVIAALNRNLPFDQFTIEQLAGDLLPSATVEQRIATGFHRATTTNVEAGSDPEETRINQVIDRLNTTAAVWLGTTLECAQCHSHKYDPFTQRDYYRLLAFFNNTALEADRKDPKTPGSIHFLGPSMPLDDPEIARREREVRDEQKRVAAELTERRRVLAQDQTGWEASLAERSRQAPATHVLEVVDFDSEGDAPHKLLDDGSVLLVDDAPDRDTYTVVCHTQLTGITGFKLETLTDPSLPGQGPGRGDDARPNFVLNTISLTAAPMSGGSAEPVELVARATSFEQKNFTLAGAVDSNPKSGWAIAPKFHEPHWATFVLRQPLGSKDGTRLVFTLVQQFGAGRTIGRLRLSALTGDPSGAAVPADVLAALHKPAADRTVKDRQRLADYSVEQDPKARTLVERQQKLQRSFQALARPTTLVMQELPEARTMHLFTRGDFRAPGEAIEPGVPGVLHPLSDGPRNRLALARWLVDRDNPLVARVVVNRWWAELFGQGLVTTLEDFGIQGERPTHPELLDWLAVEFMDGGWSMKRLLRTIVTSATYRQSSSVSPALLARDDRNLLYARGPRFRLPAEAIRDSALTAAGLISLAQGGPPIRPYQPDGLWTKVGGQPLEYVVSPGTERWRRGVYVVWKRASPYPSFMNFDATSRLACTVRRSRSNTPLQALTLLNDPSYVEAAWGLVRRVDRERGGAPLDEQLRYAFRVCLARSPTPAELAVLMKLHADQRAAARAEPESAKTLVAGAGMLADRRSIDERAAWYAVATTLLNLDETITKN